MAPLAVALLVMLRLASAVQVDLAQAAEELSIAVRADLRPIRLGSMPVASGGMLAVALGQFASGPSNRTSAVLQEGPRETLLEHLRASICSSGACASPSARRTAPRRPRSAAPVPLDPAG